jgi:hypothetical protein
MRWLLGLAVLACLPLQAAEVKKGYPASYELARMDASGERIKRVLASGEALLLLGERITVRGQDGTESGASIDFRLETAPPRQDAERDRMVLHSRVELATVQGRTRLQAPGNPESFIEGPDVDRATFTSESWRRQGDPTPIVVPFERGGQNYRLTVIIDPAYTGRQ